jgi:uncharacterized protein
VTKQKEQIIHTENGSYECHVKSNLLPQLTRLLSGTTPSDSEIDGLPIPRKPLWLTTVILILRWYRRKISINLGDRCVFEPTCSRYAELSFRKYGFFKGCALTISRLWRCRPGNGGVDVP